MLPWKKRKKSFNKRGLMFIFKGAGAFILREKALNSDTEKGKWKGLDSLVPVNMEHFPPYEKKSVGLNFLFSQSARAAQSLKTSSV